MVTRKDVDVVEIRVRYGLGASCVGRFPNGSIRGVAAREVLRRVSGSPQPTESAARTAGVLAKVVRSGRPIDVELCTGPDDETRPGDPIALEDVVVPKRSAGDRSHELERVTVLVSEAYRGGRQAC